MHYKPRANLYQDQPLRTQDDRRKQQEYAKFLEMQIKYKQLSKWEQKHALLKPEPQPQLNNTQLLPNPLLPLSRLSYVEDEKRIKMQQQLLEQDIQNYNRMLAETKRMQRKHYKSTDSQTTFTKFPSIAINRPNDPQPQVAQLENFIPVRNTPKSRKHSRLSQSVVDQQHSIPIPRARQRSYAGNESRLNASHISKNEHSYTNHNDEWHLIEQSRLQRIKETKDKILEVRQRMWDQQRDVENQIKILIDFVKYNESQARKYLKMQESMTPLLNGQSFVSVAKEELKKRGPPDQIYQEAAVADIISIELSADTQFVQHEILPQVELADSAPQEKEAAEENTIEIKDFEIYPGHYP